MEQRVFRSRAPGLHPGYGLTRCKHQPIKGPLEVLNAAVMEPLRKMSVRDLFVVPPRTSTGPFAILVS